MAEKRPFVIDIDDPLAMGGELIGEKSYTDLLAEGDENFEWKLPEDEWQAISLKLHIWHHRQSQRGCLSSSRRLFKRHQ